MALALGTLAVLSAASGCSARYVMRAAWEEAKFLWRREPIEGMLRNGRVPAGEAEQLRLVLASREFARDEIGLAVDGSYSSVSKVDGSSIIHLLTASRRDRLEPYTWWFPLVGRMPYKGFFDRDDALAAADALEERGYDTYVRPATAFSTLGWFDDPLPSTLLRRDPVMLANTILHELFHATVFVRGRMAFNESAANFVGHVGAIEFFCRPGREATAECDDARAEWADMLEVSRFLAVVLEKLGDFYRSRPSADRLEEGRRRIFDAIRARARELPLRGRRHAGFADAPLNNATLLHDRMYMKDLELFDALYRRGRGLAETIGTLRDVAAAGGDPFAAVQEIGRPPDPVQAVGSFLGAAPALP